MFARMWLGLCVKTWFLKRRRYLFWSHWHQICFEKKCILIYLGSVLFLMQIAQPSFMHLKGMTLNSPNIWHHNNKKGRLPSSHRILWQYNCSAFIFLLFPLLLFLWRTLKKLPPAVFNEFFPRAQTEEKLIVALQRPICYKKNLKREQKEESHKNSFDNQRSKASS